jgi:alanine racemase
VINAVLPPPAVRLGFDADALAANWRAMDRLSGRASAGAAVKADAYGTGAGRAVPVLARAGCRQFYIAHWREAPDVIAHVPASSVSVLHGVTCDEEVGYALATGLRPVLNSLGQVDRWLTAGGGACDLMVDTGMNRLGLRPEDCGDARLQQLQIETLMSHLSSADEDSPANDRQRAAFAAILPTLPHRRASLANGAGIMLGADFHFDATRPGLALYGGVPRSGMAPHIRQVVVPQARILQIRRVPAGETVGYNGTFAAPCDTRVGIVAMGYADGYLRCWSGKGGFVAGETRLPVIGRVSMDMTAIDLSHAPEVGEGDWVSALYDLAEAAKTCGLSQYELLTLIGPRMRA